MPKKKKNAQSPTRVPGMSSKAGVGAGDTGTNRMADPSAVLRNDEVVKSMQEMFAHLDPEVVYMVLAECDFKGNVKLVLRDRPSRQPGAPSPGDLGLAVVGWISAVVLFACRYV